MSGPTGSALRRTVGLAAATAMAVAASVALLLGFGGPARAASASPSRSAPTAQPAASGRPTANAAAAPTLGLGSIVHYRGSGFGSVRPPQVSYGGDGTSLVTHVHWTSWGGTMATGHGTAVWVWPGWCEACASVSLPATVVAFDRTTCGGHSVYGKVEWYFPSRGQTFSTRLSGENLCTGKFPNRNFHLAHCGSTPAGSGHTATAIETLQPRSDCRSLRRFVAGLGVGRDYHRSVKFLHDGWYCGSQYEHGVPQGFGCARGDFGSVNFELK